MSYITKFTDKETGKILAVSFDHECSSHLVEFMEDCDDVEIEFFEFDYKFGDDE